MTLPRKLVVPLLVIGLTAITLASWLWWQNLNKQPTQTPTNTNSSADTNAAFDLPAQLPGVNATNSTPPTPKPVEAKPSTVTPAQPTNEQTPPDAPADASLIADPSSITVVVNKQRALPSTYTPNDLRVPDVHLSKSATSAEMKIRDVAADALEQMFDAAKADDVSLTLVSGYRSYATQKSLYNRYVSQDGQTAADRYSARPGHSEHQTGLAADVGNADGNCKIDSCFGASAGGKWVADHAHEFGFVVRYQQGKESIVGFKYEPWHLRYVSKGTAGKIFATKQALEEYFDLPMAPGY